jgi:hypothetical protein
MKEGEVVGRRCRRRGAVLRDRRHPDVPGEREVQSGAAGDLRHRLKAQAAGIAAAKAGVTPRTLERAVRKVIDDAGYHDAYLHGCCHFVGSRSHDAGDYDAPLPGRGAHRRAGHLPAQRGFGVRIEDEILITPNGAEVITKASPKDPDEIERRMQSRARTPAERAMSGLRSLAFPWRSRSAVPTLRSSPVSSAKPQQTFDALSKEYLDDPRGALSHRTPRSLGDHRYDGRWPDVSKEGERSSSASRRRCSPAGGDPAGGAERGRRVDAEMLADPAALLLFSRKELRPAELQPLHYTAIIGQGLDPLVNREFGTRESRAQSLARGWTASPRCSRWPGRG